MDSFRISYTGNGELSKGHKSDIGWDVSPVSLKILFDDGDEETLTKEDFTEEKIDKVIASHAYLVAKLHFDSGIAVQPMGGSWIMAVANSRICKTNFVLNNGVGIIDPDYRGTIRFIYINTLRRGYNCTKDILMLCKTCGQLIAMKHHPLHVSRAKYLGSTLRGEGGFGSTAKD